MEGTTFTILYVTFYIIHIDIHAYIEGGRERGDHKKF